MGQNPQDDDGGGLFPGVHPSTGDSCAQYDVQFAAPGIIEWLGSDPSADVLQGQDAGANVTAGGRYNWSTKLLGGMWPVVSSIMVYGNPNFLVAPGTAPGITFGFISRGRDPVAPGTPPPIREIVFSGVMDFLPAPAVAGQLQPSLVDTNFGMGWVVPTWNGLPMSFFIDSYKNANAVGLSAAIQWSWLPMRGMR